MKTLMQILLGCILLTTFSCQKWDYFKGFVPNGEKKYPAIDVNFKAFSGNERAQLVWKHANDPAISFYTIYWNNMADSSIFRSLPSPNDTIKYNISLAEGVYEFMIYSMDGKGNKSVPRYVTGTRVYGSNYTSSLFNRGINTTNPYYFDANEKLNVNFNVSNSNESFTEVSYIDLHDQLQTVKLDFNKTSILLEDYKPGTSLKYRTAYKPNKDAIDDFFALEYSTLLIN